MIFDLDETLIHCAEVNELYDVVLTIENPDNSSKVEVNLFLVNPNRHTSRCDLMP